MKYRFDFDKKNNDLRVRFEPENYTFSAFLWLLKKQDFPYYVSQLLDCKSFGVENASFVFFHEMDWEDKDEFFSNFNREIKADEIRIRFYDGKVNYSVLKVKIFEQILYDYSIKLLEECKDDKTLPDTWTAEMQQALKKLKTKLDNESFS